MATFYPSPRPLPQAGESESRVAPLSLAAALDAEMALLERIPVERRRTVEAVDEAAVGQRREEGEDEAEMDGEEDSHGARLAQEQQQQSGEGGAAEEDQEGHVHAELAACRRRRVGDDAQPE